MKLASRILAPLALLGLFAAPLCADVIPTRYPSKSDAHQKVEKALTNSGLSAADAQNRAGRLTVQEAAHFAGQAEFHPAGQELWAGQSDNLWWEWIGGGAFLVASLIAISLVDQ